MCLETEGYDTLLVGLVDLGELLRQLRLGNIGARRVQDIDDELTAGQEAVGDEFARADCYWCVGLRGEMGKRRSAKCSQDTRAAEYIQSRDSPSSLFHPSYRAIQSS